MASRNLQHGVVLVTVIWFLAAIALAAAAFAAWSQRSLAEVELIQADTAAEVEMTSTKATVLYLMLSRGLTGEGVPLPSGSGGETVNMSLEDFLAGAEMGTAATPPVGAEVLAIDNRAYAGTAEARFSLQDESGLISLANTDEVTALRNLLLLLQVPQEQLDGLIDKLSDYQDTNDTHRLNGAESYHYREAGRREPANAPLLTTWELREVLGWDELASLWLDDRLVRSTTTAAVFAVNPNAAPPLVLQAASGLSPEGAERVAKARADKPFSSWADMAARADVNVSVSAEGAAAPVPSNKFRLTVWHARSRLERQYQLEFKPFGADGKPWLVNWVLSTAKADEHAEDKVTRPQSPVFNSPLSTPAR